MKTVDFIIIAIVVCLIAAVGMYLYRAKKRGQACVGCPYSKQCGSKTSSCSCDSKQI